MTDTPGQSAAGGYRPAGWYYAQGDPPGTQRYWDGSSWQGEPQPVNPSAQQGSTEQYGSTEPSAGYDDYRAPSTPTATGSASDPVMSPSDDWSTPPPEVPAPRGASASADTSGFISALFDTKFTTFITGRAISVVYILVLVAIALLTLFFIVGGLAGGGATALVSLILGPLVGLFYLVMIRLTLEFFVNQFRQTELLEAIADKLDQGSD